MPVTTALIAGGASTVAGGLMGYLTRPDLSAATGSAKIQALMALMNRPPEIPEIELQKYSTPEALSYLGNFTPEELQATGLPAGVINEAMRNKQLQALGGVEQLSQTGLSAIDRAALSEIQNEIAMQERGQRESILQNMAQRGISGSGQELAAQLQSSQAAAQLASQQGMQQAAQAQRARTEALANLSEMATGLEQTDFQRQAQKAQAQDVINQFNIENRNTAKLRDLNLQQSLKNEFEREKMRIAQANVDLANKQIMQNQMNSAMGQSQAQDTLGQALGAISAGQTQQQLANQQSMIQGLGTGLSVGGTVAGAALTRPSQSTTQAVAAPTTTQTVAKPTTQAVVKPIKV